VADRPPTSPALIRPVIAELGAWAIGLAVFLHALRPALFEGRTTFIHDVLYWTYPVFHFLAGSLLQGRLPSWNPFSHAGEPLYPLLLQLRLLDPVSLPVVAAGSLFTRDLTTLFNWSRMACGVVASAGAYVLLRQWTPYGLVRVTLVPLLLWSSLILTSFRQTGTNDMFLFAPFAAFFLFRLIDDGDRRWATWIGLGVSVGLAWQSYYFVGQWLFLGLALLAFLAFRRSSLAALVGAPGFWPRAAVTGLLVAAMATPNLVVFAERDRFVFPPRLVEHDYRDLNPLGGPPNHEPDWAARANDSVIMPYALVRYTGSAVTAWNLALVVAPEASRPSFPSSLRVGLFPRASELFVYFGVLGYAGALLGLLAGRHRLKCVWLVLLVGFGLLMLGPTGGLHPALYYVTPPLWLLRHTQLLLNFFLLASLYFYVLGANRVVEWSGGSLFGSPSDPEARLGRRVVASVLFAVGCYALGLGALAALVFAPTDAPTTGIAFLLAGGLAWILRRRAGRAGIFWGLAAAPLLLAVTFSPDRSALGTRGAALLLGPPLLFGAWRLLGPRVRPLALGLLALALTADLGLYLRASAVFWSEARPDRLGLVATTPEPTRVPDTRLATMHRPAPYAQAIRYLELARRTPAAFSSILADSSPWAVAPDPPMDTVMGSRRWNSLLMTRDYFGLIRAGLAPDHLGALMAVRDPLVQFRRRAVVAPAATLPAVLRSSSPTDLRESVVLHQVPPEAQPAGPVDPGPTPTVDVIGYDGDRLEVSVASDTGGYLLYVDGYDPYWEARVDGLPAAVLLANGNFKAVRVGPGRHTVRLDYEPRPFRLALCVFFGAPLAAGLAVAGGAAWRRHRAGRPTVGGGDPRSDSDRAP
jgi:hypothetical protein